MTPTDEQVEREPSPNREPWPNRVWLGSHMFQNSYDDGSYYCYELRASIKFADPAALTPQVSPELIEKLGKLANYLTEQGEYEACDLIDTVVERLTPKAKG